MLRKKGQGTLEYVILLIIVMGAFLGMANYFKRAVSGRWKGAVDDLGDQYDPRLTNTDISHRLSLNSQVRVTTVDDATGFWTMRTDVSNSIETKTGSSRIGAF